MTEMEKRSGAWARPLANLPLAFITSAIAFSAAEWLLASLPLAQAIRPYRLRLRDWNLENEAYLERAEDIPYTTKPGYTGRWSGGGNININAQGFRRDAAHRGEIYSRMDVLCMGDSFTFGYLADDADTWPAKLGRLEGPSKVVVNAGYYGGFSFDSAGLRYRHALARFHPGVVVYGVFPDNDFTDLAVWVRKDPAGGPAELKTANQVLNEAGYSVPLLRESRLFVGLSRIWSRWSRRAELAETSELLWTRVSDALRRFRQATTPVGTRLVFVILREANDLDAQDFASDQHISVEAFNAMRDDQIRRFEARLDAEQIEWYDDKPLLEGLRAGLKNHRLPPPPGPMAEPTADLEAQAARAGWESSTLAAADRVHYSPLTNAFVASWVYQRLENPHGAR
jgi:hypothetical protein